MFIIIYCLLEPEYHLDGMNALSVFKNLLAGMYVHQNTMSAKAYAKICFVSVPGTACTTVSCGYRGDWLTVKQLV